MSKNEKLIARFLSIPTDFTFDELIKLLAIYGYLLRDKGKTSGSRVIFQRKGFKPILLHKPHPGNIMKGYAVRQVLDILKQENLIK